MRGRAASLQTQGELCDHADSTHRLTMLSSAATVIAVALYFAVGLLAGLRLAQRVPTRLHARGLLLGVGALAVALHAVVVYYTTLSGGLNLSLTHALSLVACVVAFLFLVAALRQPIETLAVLIMPLAGATLILLRWWPGTPAPLPAHTGFMVFHIIVSFLAYSLLSIAVVQSLMLSFQERQLHGKHPGGFLKVLPPVQTMEILMFQMIGLGFALLSLTLVSGVFFSEEIFGRPLAFTHHIVLSIIAWFAFAVLLFGRIRFGWRGRHAVRWTLASFTLLVLAYFGSKFVFEIVIGA